MQMYSDISGLEETNKYSNSFKLRKTCHVINGLNIQEDHCGHVHKFFEEKIQRHKAV